MKDRIKSLYCTNCGKELSAKENYCPNCGQENDNKRQTFGKVMLELFQSFLSIDSSLAHSIPALLFRPAFLTKEYLRGRRKRYLDPIRMFITIVVLYFIVASWGENKESNFDDLNNIDTSALSASMDTSVIIDNEALKLSVKDRKSKITMQQLRDSLQKEDELELGDTDFPMIKSLVKSGITGTDEIMDTMQVKKTFWNRFYYTELIKLAKTEFKELKRYFISKLPWIIFCFIPVFALILKLVYIRRKFLYIDHMIFAFHLHSFYFMIGILSSIFSLFCDADIFAWMFFASVIYTISALRNFYNQGWLKTILKLLIILIFYSIAAMFSMIIIFLVIFLLY